MLSLRRRPGFAERVDSGSTALVSIFVVPAHTWTVVDDLQPAQWLINSIDSFGDDVSALVPSIFENYGRVFHPAYRHHGDGTGGRSAVSWAEIARASRTIAHPRMQFHRLFGRSANRYHRGYAPRLAGVFDQAPDEGNLTPDIAEVLAGILGRHTTTADDCWFAVWHGFSGLDEEFSSRPTFELPGRNYFLAHGTIASAAASVLRHGWQQSWNLWWPEDHAWCVTTEIDLDSTYVGASRSCIDDLLHAPGIESARVPLTAGIDAFSDTVNQGADPS